MESLEKSPESPSGILVSRPKAYPVEGVAAPRRRGAPAEFTGRRPLLRSAGWGPMPQRGTVRARRGGGDDGRRPEEQASHWPYGFEEDE
nr:unnamed protein product [Digitaria exilis]